MDVGTITALAAAGSAIANLVRDLGGSGPDTTVDQMTDQVIGLQSLIMKVQSEAFALQYENSELRTQLAEIKDWTAEKEKYELTAIGSTAFVYSLKPDEKGIEPHWICCSCYEANRKSLLVFESVYPTNPNFGYDCWVCLGCKSRIQVPEGAKPDNVRTSNHPKASGSGRVVR